MGFFIYIYQYIYIYIYIYIYMIITVISYIYIYIYANGYFLYVNSGGYVEEVRQHQIRGGDLHRGPERKKEDK